MENFRLIKKINRKKLDKDFDIIYESVKKIAISMGYDGELKIVSDSKQVNFYIPIIYQELH